VLWILRTGSPWRDLTADYGDWSNTRRRFCRWHDKGIWEKLLEIVMDEPDFEWLTIDATHYKVHQHATGTRGGNQAICSQADNLIASTISTCIVNAI